MRITCTRCPWTPAKDEPTVCPHGHTRQPYGQTLPDTVREPDAKKVEKTLPSPLAL